MGKSTVSDFWPQYVRPKKSGSPPKIEVPKKKTLTEAERGQLPPADPEWE